MHPTRALDPHATTHSALMPSEPKVLILDDQSTGRLLLSELIKSIRSDAELIMFADPFEAVEHVAAHPVDLVLTDYRMPLLNGIETIRRMRKLYSYERLPILMISAVNDQDIKHEAFEAGVTDFLIRPLDVIECRARCANLLELQMRNALTERYVRLLEQQIEERSRILRAHELDAPFRFIQIVEKFDPAHAPRLRRLAALTTLVSRKLQLPSSEVEANRVAAMLHDIGQIAIPVAIRHPNRGLTPQERLIEQSHVHVGHNLLANGRTLPLRTAATAALTHHEKFDGSGYPNGLQGTQIPQCSRIIAIASVFAGLLNDATAESELQLRQARKTVADESGCSFDPDLATVFLSFGNELRQL